MFSPKKVQVKFIKTGNIEDALKMLLAGGIVKDESDFYYRLKNGQLQETKDLSIWSICNEFEFGVINREWDLFELESAN